MAAIRADALIYQNKLALKALKLLFYFSINFEIMLVSKIQNCSNSFSSIEKYSVNSRDFSK